MSIVVATTMTALPSMSAAPQVVITGVGVVSPIGIGREAFWQSLQEGRSGVVTIGASDLGSLPVQFGGKVCGFEGKKYVKPRKAMKLMCRDIEMGFASCRLAVEDSQLDTEQVDSDRFGIIHGSEMLYGPSVELRDVFASSSADGQFDIRSFGKHFSSDMFPLWMLKYLPNMAACHVGISQQAYGPNNTVVQGEASSLLAMIEAVSVIQRGWADVMITGGTGSRLMPTSMVHLDVTDWSHRSDAPETACRPFDAERDGLVNGEGGAAFVLEAESHAKARGANILARVGGTASAFGKPDSNDRFTAAIQRTIDDAIRRSGVTASDVDHVNANGLGTVRDDHLEAVAINASLNDAPVTALKSYFGHLGAGCGAVELAASVLAFSNGTVPPTLNHSQTDRNCPIQVIHGEAKSVTKSVAIALNQSRSGQTAAVAITS